MSIAWRRRSQAAAKPDNWQATDTYNKDASSGFNTLLTGAWAQFTGQDHDRGCKPWEANSLSHSGPKKNARLTEQYFCRLCFPNCPTSFCGVSTGRVFSMNDAIARWFDPVIPGKFGWFASGFPGACSNGLIVSYTVKTPVETYTSFAFFRTRSGSVLNVLGGESVGTLRIPIK